MGLRFLFVFLNKVIEEGVRVFPSKESPHSREFVVFWGTKSGSAPKTGVIVYFDPIKLKLRTQIGLGTKQENIKFGVDWSNGSLVTGIGKKTF